MLTSKTEGGINSVLPINRQMFSHCHESRLHDKELLLGKANMVTPNILTYSFFPTTFSADYVVMGHDIMCGTSFCSAGISCPSCVPSQITMQPLPACWQDGIRNRKHLDAVQALLSNN